MFDWKSPDYLPIIKERQERLQKIRSDLHKQYAAIVYYRERADDFINDWMWTYDPRKSPALTPFILFDKQREFLLWLKERENQQEDGLAEKSRDMGCTWLCCSYAIHRWLFFDGVKIGFGSNKEGKLDRLGDPDSIFEKLRIGIRALPIEFLPSYKIGGNNKLVSYREEKDAAYLKIINRQNNSVMAGEAGDQIGRGGRSTLYFKDESAFYDRPQKVDGALSMNTDVQIDLSTPNGPDNVFARKRHSGRIPVFTFHWKSDPRKDQEWYDKQVRTRDPIIIAREIDIDYSSSKGNLCIKPKWVRAAVDFIKRFPEYEVSGMKKSGLDVSDGKEEANDLNVHTSMYGMLVTSIEDWKEDTVTKTARRAYHLSESNGVQLFNYDNVGVGAGVKGELNEILQHKAEKIPVQGINAGDTHLIGFWEPKKKNKDMFLNLRAQLTWELRRRFVKTFEKVSGKEDHPIDECISIPDHEELISQLSWLSYSFNNVGKIKIQPKDELSNSPDFSDSLMLANAGQIKPNAGVW